MALIVRPVRPRVGLEEIGPDEPDSVAVSAMVRLSVRPKGWRCRPAGVRVVNDVSDERAVASRNETSRMLAPTAAHHTIEIAGLSPPE
jgi:hypothetical protein